MSSFYSLLNNTTSMLWEFIEQGEHRVVEYSKMEVFSGLEIITGNTAVILHRLSCSRDISGAVIADKERCKSRHCWINNVFVYSQIQQDIVVHPFCQCLSDTNQYIYLCTCINCKKETFRTYVFWHVFFHPSVKMKASKSI